VIGVAGEILDDLGALVVKQGGKHWENMGKYGKISRRPRENMGRYEENMGFLVHMCLVWTF